LFFVVVRSSTRVLVAVCPRAFGGLRWVFFLGGWGTGDGCGFRLWGGVGDKKLTPTWGGGGAGRGCGQKKKKKKNKENKKKGGGGEQKGERRGKKEKGVFLAIFSFMPTIDGRELSRSTS